VSVVSGGRTIFCEGKPSSLDYKLLGQIVKDVLGDQCTIIPAGGKFTLANFAEGYFFPYDRVSQRYIIFRDRDFDTQPTSGIQLLQLNTKRGKRSTALTHRSCIENYLLDSDLIHSYWSAKHIERIENPNSKWSHSDSPGIGAIEEWIETSAKNLQFYQAVRWALGDLQSMSSAREQLKTTWTGGSGKLPESLELESCKLQALELVNQFRQAVEPVAPVNFEERLDLYKEDFTKEDFWVQRQYLIWFHGKDLQKEMQKQKPGYISLTPFFDWAVEQLDISRHPDLMDLKVRIEQL
jgi:hypothetical protein